MQSKDLVTNALRYYDKNQEKYMNLLRKAKYYTYEINRQDLQHSSIIFYDKNKKEILKSRYEFVGIYNPNVSVWIWGWAIPSLMKNQINLIKKVLNYGIELDDESIFLKSELITSRFKIVNKLQLDMHIAISSYISKEPFIISVIDNGLDAIKHNGIDILEIQKEVTDKTVLVNYLYLLDV